VCDRTRGWFFSPSIAHYCTRLSLNLRSAMRRGLATVAMAALVSVPAAAQQPQPSVGDAADRPGFADTPVLLAPGQIQVEAGFTWEHDDPGGTELTKTSTWPQIEMHGGITPRVELSIAWDGLVSVAAPESTTSATQRRRRAGQTSWVPALHRVPPTAWRRLPRAFHPRGGAFRDRGCLTPRTYDRHQWFTLCGHRRVQRDR